MAVELPDDADPATMTDGGWSGDPGDQVEALRAHREDDANRDARDSLVLTVDTSRLALDSAILGDSGPTSR